jgi:hypothetical protein
MSLLGRLSWCHATPIAMGFATSAPQTDPAAIAHNLLRAAGSLASLACAKARGATIRRDLIDVAAAPPGTATGKSRCTCPKAGTANTNG